MPTYKLHASGGHHTDSPSSRSPQVISSVSDVKFSRDGRYLMARDYMTLKYA